MAALALAAGGGGGSSSLSWERALLLIIGADAAVAGVGSRQDALDRQMLRQDRRA